MINPDPIQPFYVPLTEILKDRGYTGGDQDVSARTSFLFNIYEKAQVSISRNTLKDWFSGRRRPLFENPSRQKMYELCFVLEFNYDQVRDFFDRIYLSRSFNCRNIREAVYCYCFSKRKNFAHAASLLEQAEKILEGAPTDSEGGAPIRFTNTMEEDIIHLHSDQEFLEYVADNPESFCEYNQTIKREMDYLLERIQGTTADEELVNLHRKARARFTGINYEKFHGLVVREYFLYNSTINDLTGLNVSSIDFMLTQIFGIDLLRYYKTVAPGQSFAKNARLHDLAKINFPLKQNFSNILNETKKAQKKITTSFDGVRKSFVLLHFYMYFVSEKVMKDRAHIPPATYSGYVDDANDQLAICNYGPLYEGNPYDLLFLESARTDQPLDTFREIISDAVDGDGE